MKIIALDTETALISQLDAHPRPACITFSTGEKTGICKNEEEKKILSLLECDEIWGWNLAGFDLPVLWKHGSHAVKEAIWNALIEGRIYDGILGKRIADHARGLHSPGMTSLKDFCQESIGITIEKEGTPRLTYGDLIDVPISDWTSEQKKYAMDDAKYHYLACKYQKEKYSKYIKTMAHDCRKTFARALVASCGIRVDKKRLEEFEKEEIEKIEPLKKILRESGILRENGTRDTKKLQAHALQVEKKAGIKFPRTEKTQAVQFTEEKLLLADDPILTANKEYTALRTFLGDGLTTGRIAEMRAGGYFINRCSYDPLKATGRTGSRGAKIGKDKKGHLWGGNHQNMPRVRGMRECHVPGSGSIFVAIDFSALELHTLAQCCIKIVGYSRLAQVLNKGLDAHSITGSRFLGIKYEEFLKHPKKDHYRTLAKPFNFGVAGGMGEERFRAHAIDAYGVKISKEEFYKYKALLFSAYPEIEEYMKIQGELNTVTVPISGRIRGRVGYCDACNNPFQALGAEAATNALFACVMSCFRNGGKLNGAIPVAFVHDEILFEMKKEKALEQAKIACELMVKAGSKFTPNVPLKVEASFMPYWTKDKKIHKETEEWLVKQFSR